MTAPVAYCPQCRSWVTADGRRRGLFPPLWVQNLLFGILIAGVFGVPWLLGAIGIIAAAIAP